MNANPLTARPTWIRIVYMLLFALVIQVVGLALTLVVVVQLGAQLITGDTFAELRMFGTHLANYLRDIAAFLTFASDRLPFPFDPSRSASLRTPEPPFEPPPEAGEAAL